MKDARKLTEGAVLLAVFSVLLLLTIYIPAIGIILNFFLPLPFMLFAAKNNWKSIAVFVVASFLISFIAGNVAGISLALPYGLTGAVMGWLLQRDRSRTAILISGSLVFLVSIVLQYVVSVAFFHFNIIDEMLKVMRSSIHTFSELLQNFNQQEDKQKILDQLDKGLDLFKILVPSMFVMTSFITTFIIQLLSLPMLKKFGIKIENWKPFREISLPRSLIWYYLAVLLADMVFQPQAGTYWNAALINLIYILQMFMTFQGLTFIFWFFHQRGDSQTVSVVLLVFTFMLPILLYVVGILGIIDLGFGLRERLRKNE